MARLPTREDLGGLPSVTTGRVTPQIRTATPDVSIASRARVRGAEQIGRANVAAAEARGAAGEMIGRSLSDFGRSTGNLAGVLAQRQEEDDALAAIKAKAHRDQQYSILERELYNDPASYATHGATFTERASEIDSESMSMMPGYLQERWGPQFAADQEQDRTRVLTRANQLDREQKQGELLGVLDQRRERYLDPLTPPEQKAEELARMQESIEAARRSGLISAEKAVSLNDYAKGVAKEDAKIQILNNVDEYLAERKGITPFKRRLLMRESSGDPKIVNGLGYAGLYQFGAPRLVDLGVYSPGGNEKVKGGKWGGEKWTGEFNIPEFPEVKTLDDFLNSPEAQEHVFGLHTALMDNEIQENGFDGYLGGNVDGVKITRDGLYAMLHLGGVGGAKAALTGEENRSDINGTTVLEYAALGAPFNRYAGLDQLDQAELDAEASRVLAQDPDLRAYKTEVTKAGYDMLMDDKMTPEWIEANREILSVSDYKAFLRGLEPGTTRKTEPEEYLRLYDLADNDPQAAMEELRDLYAQDNIAKSDFNKLFNQARGNIESARGRPYATELRDYVRKELSPGQRDPAWMRSRTLDALFQYDDWLEANPGASREEIRKQAQTIVEDYKAIRYGRGVTELPLPKYVSGSRQDVTEDALKEAQNKIVSDVKSGAMTPDDAATQARILRRWTDLVKYKRAQ